MDGIKKKVTVAVDPGVHALGVAVFHDKALFWAGLVKGSRSDGAAAAQGAFWALLKELHGLGVRQWYQGVVEWPNHDDERARHSRESMADLTGVAGAVAALLGMHGTLRSPMPSQWKGQLPKHIHHGRLFGEVVYAARLPAVAGWAPRGDGVGIDVSRVRWDRSRTENTDIADAIGLGLWAVSARAAGRP